MGKLRKVMGVAAAVATVGTAGLLSAPAASAQTGPPCDARAAACVSVSGKTAWLMDNGTVIYGPTQISTGKPGYETPPGEFPVTWKNIDHWSRAYDAPMPFSVFFTRDGIAFHEGSLTTQSHGCVRLSPEAARAFFGTLQPGDLVQVVA